MLENRAIDREGGVLVAGGHEDFSDRCERLRVARSDLQVLPVGCDRVVVVLAGVVRRGQVEHRLFLIVRELGVAGRVDRHAEVMRRGIVLR